MLRMNSERTPDGTNGENAEPQSVTSDRRSLRLATFNAGLAVGMIDHSAERAPYVVEALRRESLDVLCVQEFWLDEHWKQLVAAVGSSLPNRLRPTASSEPARAPCTEREIAPVASCVEEYCADVDASELALCAVRHCMNLAGGLSSACIGCLSRDPLRGSKEILAECVQTKAISSGPATKAGKRAPSARSAEPSGYFYGGSFGIGLLTRDRMLAADVLRIPSTQHPRAVLYARIDTPVVKDLHLFCTHLTPLLQAVPHAGRGSWRDEQSQQVNAMLAFIEQKTSAGDAVVVLGDLNCGPAVGANIAARLPEHYERFMARGFRNPYLDPKDPECSFCYSNSLSGGSGGGGILIDHILTRGIALHARAERMLDSPLDIAAGGLSVRTAYSDHYGLVLELGR